MTAIVLHPNQQPLEENDYHEFHFKDEKTEVQLHSH
jgi:hypothetical protein